MSGDPQFEALLAYLQRSRGFDFGAYKREGLVRRVRKRLDVVGIKDYADYLDYLEVNPEEFSDLFNAMLINVTDFFRDAQAWEFLAESVLPKICGGDGPIRAWSCGCASGQEAYTVAMLLAERLGRKTFRERVKVYATDVDDAALEEARLATYSLKQVEDVPDALLKKYFDRGSKGYAFDKELRRSVIFGRNDLIKDAPISRLDLLVCRNTLMYFNAETQNRILQRFHFALNDAGVLFLGKAELMLAHGHQFAAIDVKRRIFSKVPVPGRRERPIHLPMNGGNGGGPVEGDTRLRQAAFETSPVGEVVIDPSGRVMELNERARVLLGVTGRDRSGVLDVGDFGDRLPGLRAALGQAQAEVRAVSLRGVECANDGGDPLVLDLQVVPVVEGTALVGLSLFMTDATRTRRLQQELASAREELEAVSEELESTNEELETTNEELQSSNEELETTNEELQSTNEELETMNEELQSTNEELQTVNEEVRTRSEELHESNAFLASILTSLRSAVVVLDANMHVIVWNRRAEDLWGLRADEVQGKHFLSLDIGLPLDKLKQPLRACLAGASEGAEQAIEATNRRGRTIRCEVLLTPLTTRDQGIRGVILLMQER